MACGNSSVAEFQIQAEPSPNHHLTRSFGETTAAGLALYPRREVREVGTGIQSRCAFNGGRISDRSWVAHGLALVNSRSQDLWTRLAVIVPNELERKAPTTRGPPESQSRV